MSIIHCTATLTGFLGVDMATVMWHGMICVGACFVQSSPVL